MNDSIKEAFLWIIKHKYLFVTIAFIAIMVLFDENNMLKHIKNQREISRLKSEISAMQQEYADVQQRMQELHQDSGLMEKVAREKYGMHLDDEEIFIIKD
ncbi:MAG: septum formation initiator family protein [Bacteroidaceae bacterium]|nr:septum formation initiator family protein [Bacteroidaceae bacterium]